MADSWGDSAVLPVWTQVYKMQSNGNGATPFPATPTPSDGVSACTTLPGPNVTNSTGEKRKLREVVKMASQEQGRFALGGDDLAGAKYGGHCSGCRHPITAASSREWSKKVRRPCPRCGRAKW